MFYDGLVSITAFRDAGNFSGNGTSTGETFHAVDHEPIRKKKNEKSPREGNPDAALATYTYKRAR